MKNYVEPFAGSLAVLLERPSTHRHDLSTVNDLDGFIANFWRAVIAAPDEVAHYADWPPNENDMHARHAWLVQRTETLRAQLEGDPDYYDAKIAGWWVWGISLWIGSGWCSGDGSWVPVDGKLTYIKDKTGIRRKLIHLGDKGQGVHRQLIHLGNKGQGVHRKRIHLGDKGRGVHRTRIHLGTWQFSASPQNLGDGIYNYMQALAAKLRHVRVACGDWSRVCGPSVTFKHGLTGVFLDPPYSDDAGRANDLYAEDNYTVAHDVREWAIENGDNPLLRIALCGYEREHGPHMPDDWECVSWKPRGGYDGQNKSGGNDNRNEERIWFSPHCIGKFESLPIFSNGAGGG